MSTSQDNIAAEEPSLSESLSSTRSDDHAAAKATTPSKSSSSMLDGGSASSSIIEIPPEEHRQWSEMNTKERQHFVWSTVWKTTAIIGLLYIFLVGLSLLSTSFKVISGPVSGSIFSFIDQPIAGLMVGMLMTVVLQSSSTTTSLAVGLVASGELSVHNSIPVIMGANIGTSVTNTIVSLAHVRVPAEFELAFSGATVHDFFNILAVLVFLPLEIVFNGFEKFSAVLVEPLSGASTFPSPIKAVVDPFAKLILKQDSCVQKALGIFDKSANGGLTFFQGCISSCGEDLCPEVAEDATDFATCTPCGPETFKLVTGGVFKGSSLDDTSVGVIVAIIAVVFVVFALLFLVKLLGVILKGRASVWFRKSLDLNPYIAMLVGCVVTILVQSSSITTSSLVPLVGHGAITLEQMFPTTLGANVGTTFTGLLAASASGATEGVQIALCHMMFNVFGILLFYPVRYIRQAPLECARSLGYQVRKRRWTAALYMVSVFVVIPIILLALSLAGTGGLVIGAILLYGGVVAAFAWRQLRVRRPDLIPEWVPALLHPNDRETGVVGAKGTTASSPSVTDGGKDASSRASDTDSDDVVAVADDDNSQIELVHQSA